MEYKHCLQITNEYTTTARRQRKSCTNCYKIGLKAKTISTFCTACLGKPFLCVDCFEEVHKQELESTGKHYLQLTNEYYNPDRRKRKPCTNCYRRLVAKRGSKAAKNTKTVATFCTKCPETPFLCVDCFEE